MQRNVAALHDGAGANRELVAAIVAKEHTGLRLAAHAGDVDGATVRAHRLAIPARGFDVGLRLGFVVEDRVGDINVHA